MNKRNSTRDKAVERLEIYLDGCNQMCREPNDPRALEGQTLWPPQGYLDLLERAIRDLASLYSRGEGSTWSCILAIENNRPSLKLKKRIEGLVDRASELSRELPRAIEIYRQAMAGSEAARSCYGDLGKCFDGQSGIMSIKWHNHETILETSTTEGESCRDKAAQICIDWLRWFLQIGVPALTLEFWLVNIGNPSLAKKLHCSDSADVLGKLAEKTREGRRKELAALRQKKRRLKNKGIGAEYEIGAAKGKDFSSRKRDASPVVLP
jgi:hypothetical protein